MHYLVSLISYHPVDRKRLPVCCAECGGDMFQSLRYRFCLVERETANWVDCLIEMDSFTVYTLKFKQFRWTNTM